MDADLVVDDEFEARKADPGIGEPGEGHGLAGIAHIQHDLQGRGRQPAEFGALDLKVQQAGIDRAGLAF